MILYHATTPNKVQKYHFSNQINKPVRGFTTLQGAMAWACKTGRSVILKIEDSNCHKLPDHHNQYGEAWWIDNDVKEWKCVFSPKDA
jgi:antibiotic biosynthesis monooxygenase (ABM) superfamily enzyme